ncbi:hypothetical protein Cni_G20532 [Canna indica]|uniref:Uncharacterized protein n=1 Tax=Canna indica TaxID=4628 RepID=A0AAQ3KRI1_9LILI|nr:hypothetical protein Cni_G20532 [Canna indica]
MTNCSESEQAAATAEAFEEEEEDDEAGDVGGLGSRKWATAEERGSFDAQVFDKRQVTKKKGKVTKLLLFPIRRLEELYVERRQKRKKRRSARPPAVPFPYAYDDPAAANGCFVCCTRPPPISDDLPLGVNPELGTRPSLSSYRRFLKSILENNDFYSKECNVHGDIRPPERPEDVD